MIQPSLVFRVLLMYICVAPPFPAMAEAPQNIESVFINGDTYQITVCTLKHANRAQVGAVFPFARYEDNAYGFVYFDPELPAHLMLEESQTGTLRFSRSSHAEVQVNATQLFSLWTEQGRNGTSGKRYAASSAKLWSTSMSSIYIDPVQGDCSRLYDTVTVHLDAPVRFVTLTVKEVSSEEVKQIGVTSDGQVFTSRQEVIRAVRTGLRKTDATKMPARIENAGTDSSGENPGKASLGENAGTDSPGDPKTQK